MRDGSTRLSLLDAGVGSLFFRHYRCWPGSGGWSRYKVMANVRSMSIFSPAARHVEIVSLAYRCRRRRSITDPQWRAAR